ncbi:MAG: S-layer homology domain-containing protein [Oscillospiraceae bacterium]|jgi:hypothetical protein|nr:S-layer homology domain-containing protein [Oscillospiraceae bacterium]
MKLTKIIALTLALWLMTALVLPAAMAADGAAISPEGLFVSAEEEALAWARQDFTYYRPETFGPGVSGTAAALMQNSGTRLFSDSVYALPSDTAGDHIVSPVSLKKAGHDNYMNGGTNGRFNPDGGLTRAEAAQTVYNLLAGAVPFEDVYTDVDASGWYASAVNTLAALGVLGGRDGDFHPDRPLTRAEFVAMLSHFEALAAYTDLVFPDVPLTHWAYPYIASAVAKGWLNGFEDGSFRPDAGLTRAQAAVILNRVLGRYPDKAYIDANPDMRIFVEALENHWAYYDIMEATVSHREQLSGGAESWLSHEDMGFTAVTGRYYIRNRLRYYDGEAGSFARNVQIGGFYYDDQGFYSTGSAELDGYLYDTAAEIFNAGMTKEEMLRAAFLYVRDSFAYLRRNSYAIGETGWEIQDAITMFSTRYGNCYCYAAAFYYLARWIGYDALIYAGTVGANASPHSWVEIYFDGKPYIFDTELEMARLRDGQTYFVLYMLPYEQVPWSYRRA